MDFEAYFKVHSLVSVHPRNIKLGQMTNLNMIFHVMVSDYRLVKIWNSPQVPAELRNGQLINALAKLHRWIKMNRELKQGDDDDGEDDAQ